MLRRFIDAVGDAVGTSEYKKTYKPFFKDLLNRDLSRDVYDDNKDEISRRYCEYKREKGIVESGAYGRKWNDLRRIVLEINNFSDIHKLPLHKPDAP